MNYPVTGTMGKKQRHMINHKTTQGRNWTLFPLIIKTEGNFYPFFL
jgi:hypothetical protein